MSEKKRRRFTAEYKAESVKFYEESGRSLQSVAEELGVHANQLDASGLSLRRVENGLESRSKIRTLRDVLNRRVPTRFLGSDQFSRR